MSKENAGNFFEDFQPGQVLRHATPRTLTAGDQALYTALYGSRFALQSSDVFARQLGLAQAPLDDLLVFHVVFGKTVPDVSLNAVANLGYAAGHFGAPVYPGDTLSAESEVIGVKQNSNGKTGVVYVRTRGVNQDGALVADYIRWVMVRKKDPASAAPEPQVPDLPDAASADRQAIPQGLDFSAFDFAAAGSPHRWDDYRIGEKVDHGDAMTIEEAEHQLATRLYQNTARVHFNQHAEGQGRFGRRIVYGGHVISLVRALSFNGLGTAVKLLAINGGTHAAPSFAGDTIYAWSEVLDKSEVAGRPDLAVLRLRTVAAKDHACGGFPYKDAEGRYHPAVVLDLDYSVLLPRA
ncbi:MaoC family dehydratase [Pelagibius litoralis]|uniref:MaoC family dehydratase n=1 Tax=Pelagibius litoralis TaxID=374515 RepID=A0A967C891_9PROT|nr:MaoC family dehydratase [Pelagibius litoralis]NIA68242.1 MaoC family dehydratase [Pelagibius litoralis]